MVSHQRFSDSQNGFVTPQNNFVDPQNSFVTSINDVGALQDDFVKLQNAQSVFLRRCNAIINKSQRLIKVFLKV
jgi:hypothetical protein